MKMTIKLLVLVFAVTGFSRFTHAGQNDSDSNQDPAYLEQLSNDIYDCYHTFRQNSRDLSDQCEALVDVAKSLSRVCDQGQQEFQHQDNVHENLCIRAKDFNGLVIERNYRAAHADDESFGDRIRGIKDGIFDRLRRATGCDDVDVGRVGMKTPPEVRARGMRSPHGTGATCTWRF